MESCIYKGYVSHKRLLPIKHFFAYKTFSLLLDLDELDLANKKIAFFSINKFNLLSFYNKDHGDRDGKDLKNWVKNIIKKYDLNSNITKIKILCYPRILGYVFNPLSVYYCYENSQLKIILYEVKNTFNEQHTYIFKNKGKNKIEQTCKKKFYVSPFMDMGTWYDFKLIRPDKKLFVSIKQTDNKGLVLTAVQTGERKEFSLKQLIINFFQYPLMTIKVISAIHFEAFLLWKKGAIYRSRDKKIKNNLSYEKN